MDSIEHRKALGKRIADLRADKGLTQPQLAAAAGISQPSLWSIEKGQTVEITARTLIALCRALDTTWEHLWDGATVIAEGETELMALYRQMSEPGRMAVLQSARTVHSAMPPAKPPTIQKLLTAPAPRRRTTSAKKG